MKPRYLVPSVSPSEPNNHPRPDWESNPERHEKSKNIHKKGIKLKVAQHRSGVLHGSEINTQINTERELTILYYFCTLSKLSFFLFMSNVSNFVFYVNFQTSWAFKLQGWIKTDQWSGDSATLAVSHCQAPVVSLRCYHPRHGRWPPLASASPYRKFPIILTRA